MLLKYNLQNTQITKPIISYKSIKIKDIDGKLYRLTIKTDNPHNLHVGESIIISNKTKDITEELVITNIDFTKNQFVVELNIYNDFMIKNKININNGNEQTLYYYTTDRIIKRINDNSSFSIYYDDLVYDNAFLINSNEFKSVHNLDTNKTYMVMDNRFIYKKGDEFYLLPNVSLLENKVYFSLKLPISSSFKIDLNDEIIANQYFNDVKKELISSIVDYEKMCFLPCKQQKQKDENNKETVLLNRINKIKFNLFFRKRDTNWISDDTMEWNVNTKDNNGLSCDNADSLLALGFTDDDVFFRKQKLTKSFLRLSFYDSKNPLNQMLLYYSTIFFDSDDLFSNYMSNLSTNIKPIVQHIETSFSIHDRFNQHKSSEGFYLYLFPSLVNTTIYMKVEFNHAGYGKTIPFIHPTSSGKNYTDITKETLFPTNYIDKNNSNKLDLNSFYNDLYIPIKVTFDDYINDYVYYFENLWISDSASADNEIVLNLYEPKINPTPKEE